MLLDRLHEELCYSRDCDGATSSSLITDTFQGDLQNEVCVCMYVCMSVCVCVYGDW